MTVARIYMVHLLGGGGDVACNRCVVEARHEHKGEVVSTALIDAPGDICQWCGIRQGEEFDSGL